MRVWVNNNAVDGQKCTSQQPGYSTHILQGEQKILNLTLSAQFGISPLLLVVIPYSSTDIFWAVISILSHWYSFLISKKDHHLFSLINQYQHSLTTMNIYEPPSSITILNSWPARPACQLAINEGVDVPAGWSPRSACMMRGSRCPACATFCPAPAQPNRTVHPWNRGTDPCFLMIQNSWFIIVEYLWSMAVIWFHDLN